MIAAPARVVANKRTLIGVRSSPESATAQQSTAPRPYLTTIVIATARWLD